MRPHIIPKPQGRLIYRCLECNAEYEIERLLYTCPACSQVLLIEDTAFERYKKISADTWRQIFDYRKMLNIPALKGVFLFYEFVAPILPLEAIVYLGEGHTPMIAANSVLEEKAGQRFYFKNDGQNPSASFKDRGMASAFSYLNYMIQGGKISDLLAICASTGDTSASAALYAAYLKPDIKSAVLLPHKKVTPQQLAQPLGSGAAVFEIPGVFDDCMRVVEALSEKYNVALLNSKNAWRILGQESYSYEIAQYFDYDLTHKVVVVPIGNAGNITAVMSGFLKFFQAGIIDTLPKIIGVQSRHANPVFRYYREPDKKTRKFKPMTVKPSVAQAAMIGNPVSMPRVIHLVERYNELAGAPKVFVVEVTEQAIMDWQLQANQHGHIACTQGGESLAGLIVAKQQGLLEKEDIVVLDSTAHALKFSVFQDMYFGNKFPSEYKIKPVEALMHAPQLIKPKDLKDLLAAGRPLRGESLKRFVERESEEIARILGLEKL